MRSLSRFSCSSCGYAVMLPADSTGAGVCPRCREVVNGVLADAPWDQSPTARGLCALRCPGCDGVLRPWRNRTCPSCGGTLDSEQ